MNTTFPPVAASLTQSAAAPIQPFCGQSAVVADTSVALADIAQYQACALTNTGVTPFVVGTHTKDQLVIAANAALNTARVSYYREAYMNHAVVTWPASLDSLDKRKVFVNGTGIRVGHLGNNPVNPVVGG